VLNPREALPLAEAAARRALGGAKDLAEAHAALADVKKDQWDWKTAEAEYRRALQLNPNLPAARQGLAIGLSVMGRHQEALAEALRLRNLDPIGSSIIDLAATYYNMRRFEDALVTLGQAADRDPSAPAPWTWTGIVRGALGEFQLASRALEKAVRLGDFSAATQCYYVYDLARNGSPALARQVLARIEQPSQFVPPSSLAIAYTGLGDRERAFQILEQGFATRDPLMQYIGVEAHFDDLRKDQRFQELLRKIGIPSQETFRQ
jgi:tetratricopeptide (TPR) repeat protein